MSRKKLYFQEKKIKFFDHHPGFVVNVENNSPLAISFVGYAVQK